MTAYGRKQPVRNLDFRQSERPLLMKAEIHNPSGDGSVSEDEFDNIHQ